MSGETEKPIFRLVGGQAFAVCILAVLALFAQLAHGSSSLVLPFEAVDAALALQRPAVTAASLTLSGEEDVSIEGSSTSPVCHNFSFGAPDKKEFYSPNYPNNYPNNTDCVKVLKADPGHLLRLDFRDDFHLEPSEDCRYDYLEVRDGAHGYSTLIGTYCDNHFPPMLTSSDRYLWLRFRSDENIEYSGFKAVYQYIPRPTSAVHQPEMDMCRIDVGGMEGWVNRSDIESHRVAHSMTYGVPLDCMWVIRVKEGWKIQLAFLKFKLEKPNDCDSNFVDVFSTQTDLPNRLKNFCGSIADSVTSTTNVLHVRFFGEAKAINSTFEALYTAFRDKAAGQGCDSDEFDCEDNTCISRSMRCNGRINCRFRWDEDECISKHVSILNSEHIIIILVIFTLILSGMCFAFVFNCTRKLIRDHRIMKEHMRQSRENRLDDVGRGPCPELHTVSMTMLADNASGSFGADKIRASMTRYSSEPPRCRDTTPDEEEPGHGCYVPTLAGDPGGSPLPTALHDCPHGKRYNGLYAGAHDSFPTISKSPSIEVRDNECQTRSSLFHQSDVIPPPPPAPRYAMRMPMAVMVGGEPRPYAYGARAGVSTPSHVPAADTDHASPANRFRAAATERLAAERDRAAADSAGALAADVIVTLEAFN
ncbi:neuropilin and tolloid-like protein 1 isoform X3 [Cloeon dipterum]|uniref:neuropilin and tolloid-like protein 1 isoform X3 n=2 Tax=Cloeon dipterum TaxID=197152 RepID=UPI00321FB3A6